MFVIKIFKKQKLLIFTSVPNITMRKKKYHTAVTFGETRVSCLDLHNEWSLTLLSRTDVQYVVTKKFF